MGLTLIADSGATKAQWCLVNNEKTNSIFTQGISPYFLSKSQIEAVLEKELLSSIKGHDIKEVFYYGTGVRDVSNAEIIRSALKNTFKSAEVEVSDDMLAAARSLNGRKPGLACNLGTGSFSCFYNGKKIEKEILGHGFVLGDEGSGAYLGRKVLQYFLYETFDDDLKARFDTKYDLNRSVILDHVYKKPMPSRYLASFAMFLAENRGHYMIENIIEDGLNDFFFQHLCKYSEVWKNPVNFVGSIAHGFSDVIAGLCQSYEFELGIIIKNPMEGLVKYHGVKE